VIRELWNEKDLEGSCRDLILRYYPGNRLEGLRKTTKSLSQGNRSTGLDLKPGPPKYEAEVLSTLPNFPNSWGFVIICKIKFTYLLYIYIAACLTVDFKQPRANSNVLKSLVLLCVTINHVLFAPRVQHVRPKWHSICRMSSSTWQSLMLYTCALLERVLFLNKKHLQ
jgi:hypothetical protein